MKQIFSIFLIIFTGQLAAETLFEVKDSLNNPVLKVSDDGIAVMNQTDTIMVISTTEIKAVIDDSKALSRKFSVSTTSAKKGLYTDLFDVSLGSATMREATAGGRYTDFSPDNIFLGLNAGAATVPSTFSGKHNVFLGNDAGVANQLGTGNIYIGEKAGNKNVMGGTNVMIGSSAGLNTIQGEENVYIGFTSGSLSDYGFSNVYLGAFTGGSGGDQNTLIGSNCGRSITGSGNVMMGYRSGFNESGSNKLYIANSDTSSPLIKGTFPNVDLAINAADIYANGRLSIKGGTAIGMTQAGTVTIGTFVGQTGIKTITLTFPKAFSSVPKIYITPKGANGVSQSFGVTVRDITTTTCVIMISQLSPTVNGQWSQNLLADWIAWE